MRADWATPSGLVLRRYDDWSGGEGDDDWADNDRRLAVLSRRADEVARICWRHKAKAALWARHDAAGSNSWALAVGSDEWRGGTGAPRFKCWCLGAKRSGSGDSKRLGEVQSSAVDAVVATGLPSTSPGAVQCGAVQRPPPFGQGFALIRTMPTRCLPPCSSALPHCSLHH